LHVCDAIFVSKGKLYLAEGIESSSIEPYLLLQGLLDEVALVYRDISFSRHLASGQMSVVLVVEVVRSAGMENAAGTEKREGASLARLFVLDGRATLHNHTPSKPLQPPARLPKPVPDTPKESQ
jgi:hypothetical protein